ncbi:hypothetical protein HHK36_027643 [Tetracentron sinense]|uniref:CCHC-type domain-containing protein n=1 Tax=Tetracentron sinense TaxID=13715 RepID=A0A834YJH8_TETSI|nr:hypothetical protein HHK36_027643 [Tetracentron sinense]
MTTPFLLSSPTSLPSQPGPAFSASSDEDEIIEVDESILAKSRRKYLVSLVRWFLADRPINRRSASVSIINAWRLQGHVHYTELAQNRLLFTFDLESDLSKVLARAPWCFMGYPILLSRWSPDTPPLSLHLSSLPIWIQLHGLSPDLHIVEVGSQLCKSLGEVLSVDLPEDGLAQWGKFLRVRVCMDVLKPLVAGKCIRSLSNGRLPIQFRYERLPRFCFHCGIMGHVIFNCSSASSSSGEGRANRFGPWLRAELPEIHPFGSSKPLDTGLHDPMRSGPLGSVSDGLRRCSESSASPVVESVLVLAELTWSAATSPHAGLPTSHGFCSSFDNCPPPHPISNLEPVTSSDRSLILSPLPIHSSVTILPAFNEPISSYIETSVIQNNPTHSLVQVERLEIRTRFLSISFNPDPPPASNLTLIPMDSVSQEVGRLSNMGPTHFGPVPRSLRSNARLSPYVGTRRDSYLAPVDDSAIISKDSLHPLSLDDVIRRRRNLISCLRNVNGDWLYNPSDIQADILDHFTSVFRSSNPSGIQAVLQQVPTRITPDMLSILDSPFTEAEIFTALSQIGLLKAPGPDGYPAQFFQSEWSTIGSDIVLAAVINEILRFYGAATGQLINKKKSDLIDPISKGWNLNALHCLFSDEECSAILAIQPSSRGVADRWVWHFDSKGRFSVKSAYHVAMHNGSSPIVTSRGSAILDNPSLWKSILQMKIPRKLQFFIWRGCSNALAVEANLAHRNIARGVLCPWCGCADETVEHCLIQCTFARAVWFSSPLALHHRPQGSCSFAEWWIAIVNHLRLQPEPTSRSGWPLVSPKPPISAPSIWESPLAGFIKINCDGAFVHQGSTGGAAAVGRDSVGQVVDFRVKVSACSSPIMAEAKAICLGILLASESQWKNIIVESDSLSLILALNSSGGSFPLEVLILMEDMKASLCGFERVSFRLFLVL